MTKRQSDRAFGLTFAAVFTLVFAVTWLAFDARLWWSLATAAVFFAVALTYPLALLPLNRLWGRFAMALGQLNNRLLLGIVFFGLVTPLGMALRLIGKDPRQRRYQPTADSYLTPVTRGTDTATLRDPF